MLLSVREETKGLDAVLDGIMLDKIIIEGGLQIILALNHGYQVINHEGEITYIKDIYDYIHYQLLFLRTF